MSNMNIKRSDSTPVKENDFVPVKNTFIRPQKVKDFEFIPPDKNNRKQSGEDEL